jgi:beta-fructofuranosidase
MVIGSRVAGQGGLVLRYRSDDLVHWDDCGPLLQAGAAPAAPFSTGAVWECPNFFPLGDEHALIISAQSAHGELLYPVYFTGPFDGERFAPRASDVLVHGSIFYAPQVLRLADGRVVMWGWLREGRPEREALSTGWAGVMSLPIALSALPDGRLALAPVDEIKTLRRQHWHMDGRGLAPGERWPLDGVSGDALEIAAEVEPGRDAVLGLNLLCSPEGTPQARVVYDAALGRLSVEPGPSFTSTVATPERYTAPLPHMGRLRLRVFLDRSVIEVFANDTCCLAARLYPERAEYQALGLSLMAGSATLRSLDVWALAP